MDHSLKSICNEFTFLVDLLPNKLLRRYGFRIFIRASCKANESIQASQPEKHGNLYLTVENSLCSHGGLMICRQLAVRDRTAIGKWSGLDILDYVYFEDQGVKDF